MFTSLKTFIDLRLGEGLIFDELIDESNFYLKTNYQHFDRLIGFLKADPDLRLNFLDHIFVLPGESPIFIAPPPAPVLSIVYQLKSLKLPYQASLVVDVLPGQEIIPSIAKHFLGARWLEEDIGDEYMLTIQDQT